MSDDEHDGMPDGFAVPLPPVPSALLEGIFGIKSKETQEKEAMTKEANDLRVRTFVEGLDDDQAETLEWLMGSFASEGQHNYYTAMFLGMLKADHWRRHPISAEVSLGDADGNA